MADLLKTDDTCEQDREWLHSEIEKVWAANEDCDYVDNVRLAVEGGSSEEVYDDARQSGCCGSVDVELKGSPSGAVYLFGFNYGH